MKKHFQILLVAIALIACNNNRIKSTIPKQDSKAVSPIDSSATNDSSLTKNEEKEILVKRGSYEDGQFRITAYSRFILPDKLSYDSSYYFKENSLSLTDKNTNRTYKIQLTDPCSDNDEIVIDNVTNPLRFNKPVFEISTPDCSDWHISEFISFKKNTLQKLFEISDMGPAKLMKTDEYTLTGTVRDRDEIVADFQDYPITVSLTDYSVTTTKPSRQQIDFESEALDEIHGFQADDKILTTPYIIKKGTKLVVDSLFRDTQQVRLKLNSSLYIICPVSEVKGKLQGNSAG
jgi:hypothetical protein